MGSQMLLEQMLLAECFMLECVCLYQEHSQHGVKGTLDPRKFITIGIWLYFRQQPDGSGKLEAKQLRLTVVSAMSSCVTPSKSKVEVIIFEYKRMTYKSNVAYV